VNVEVRDAARVLSGGDWRVSGLGEELLDLFGHSRNGFSVGHLLGRR
jgi:hypothetical protein